MWAQLLLGILALSPAIAEKSLPNYLVTLPAQLNFPSTQKVCLDLSPGNHDVKFTITLETKDKTQKLLETSGLKKRHFHCTSFLVPPPAGGTEEVATIWVSGTGNSINFVEKKKVLIQRQENGIFIQTDKPIYNPGHKVHFRIVTLNSSFLPVNDKYAMVELQDPNSNRIAQWLEVMPEQGIADLSFQLAPEATLGTYTVAVAGGKTFGTFLVEEYVLPKFQVDVVEPKQLSTVEESFLVKICCRYTYGKPMRGAAQVSVCQKAYTHHFPEAEWEQLPDRCKNLSGQTDKSGCFSASVDMSTFNLTGYTYSHSINIVATVVEEGTGAEANTTQDIYISSEMGSITFEDTKNFYYPNFPFTGKIRVRGHDGSPLKNHSVFLVISGINGTTNQTLTTDNDGLAPFELDTVSWNGRDISLEGRFQMEDLVYKPEQVPHYYRNDYLRLQPFYNTTRSFLGIRQPNGVLACGQPQEVLVDYYIDPADAIPAQEVIFSYYVVGKGRLEIEGQKHLNSEKEGMKGSFSISLTFTSRLAPHPSLVIYAIFPSGAVIADKIQFSVEMCFDNQVSLGFSPSQQLPGADVELQLQATPGSLCAVRAVDKSVSLLRPERELSNNSIYRMFSFWYGHYPHQVAEYDECPMSGFWNSPQTLSVMWRPWFSERVDLFHFFQDMGLKILSNAQIKKPVDCSHQSLKHSIAVAEANYGNRLVSFESSSSSSLQSEDPQIRQYFPETWLWDLFPVGNSGKEAVHVTVPDTITEWKAMTFCTSQTSGFGLSPTVGLTAFKPFFVDLTLPYSVVRGESFRLTATIFNYLKDCIRVHTHLAKSDEYQVESWTGPQDSSCLCADEAKSYHWNITAIKLGHVNFTVTTKILDSDELCGRQKGFVPEKGQSDTLIKPVLVKPEGVLVEKTHSSLLCPKGQVVSESISLELPVDVVPDSAKAYVAALGDIMGTALQNLDNLVQMPRGCGEQNMVLFAPIIYVLQYLKRARLLTEEIRSRAVGFLELGYQKELLYKHSNGSYSAFGEQDENGNTWLTAFVTKCFGQAQEFIFIDEKNIQDALKWMAENQLPSGCYANVGKLLHTAMKGGVDDETSLTAYITAALLEMSKTIQDPMVSRGLRCLRSSVSSTNSLYTQALLAYTFSLAGEMDIRNTLLEKLDQQAIITGESIHWSQKPTRSQDARPWSEPEAVDVELTAYILLAQLSKASLTQKEIAKATAIVAWLAKQRNAYGGFSSTQDTVVALQALAKYATTAYVPSEEVNLAVKSSENFQRAFNIQAANRLVFQQETLPNIPGAYTLEASGQGCVYVQTVLKYNIPPPKFADTFSLSVEVGKDTCEQVTSPRSLVLTIHTSYVGSRSSSNMAIVEVKMLSGFSPMEGTNQLLLQQPLVKKVESGTDVLNIYLEELNKTTQAFTFTISQRMLVTNLKPATITVYDYYLPGEQATIQYSDPCE
ncbi:alpha-2-macroglobulin-like protein 1 isoform X1 [Prionailurus viverrinus]|uniref:alpha-2-macroglobulin-like protein 1 isoform X1 n=2 Tax=Prionailurus viverrinus TaxID=61388 RepID=UPI001FF38767|nr:alpha-2-macroglobulin-like protein 1 isoform X1 [Prionailurus viverrinus]XP_047724586.1 alpha-2-macroglobulin-like protein 1 isoform X1 [Prionailurus viverrinus]